MAGVALVAAMPIKLFSEQAYESVKARLTYSEIVAITLRNNSAKIAVNVARNNALLKALREVGRG
jgi:hypothetical protein